MEECELENRILMYRYDEIGIDIDTIRLGSESELRIRTADDAMMWVTNNPRTFSCRFAALILR